MKRTFIAFDITPSPDTRTLYEEIKRKLGSEKIGWTPDTQFHITIKFLGDTDEKYLSGIMQSLRTVCGHYKPFNVMLKGLGVFSSLRDPRIIWMGCKVEESFGSMHRDIEKVMIPFGFEKEHRKFSPHLTLGRIKHIRDGNVLPELIKTYNNSEFQQQRVKEIILYESQLLPSGARYTPLETFLL